MIGIIQTNLEEALIGNKDLVCSGTWGEPVASQVGVPEDCPIVVVQMILINWFCTAFVKTKSQADLYSHVDDWIILLREPDKAFQTIGSINKLAESLGMILSLKKSNVFATQLGRARALQRQLQQMV